MNEGFFEGKDFEGGEFKALIPKYYPQKYKKYIEEETELLKIKLKGANRILEAGIGIGRLIPKEYLKKYNVRNLFKYNLPDA